MEQRYAGLTRVEIRCAQQQIYNFTNNYEWGYQVNLTLILRITCLVYLNMLSRQVLTKYILWKHTGRAFWRELKHIHERTFGQC